MEITPKNICVNYLPVRNRCLKLGADPGMNEGLGINEQPKENSAPTPKPINWDEVQSPNKPEDNATKSQTFYQNTAPVEDYRVGDIWIDTNDSNHAYRADESLSWVSIRDGSIFSGAWDDITGANKPDDNADVTQTVIDGGLITTGYITLSTSGNIKSGQTAYATGTGFWLGNDSGTPKFSIGDATSYMRWDGSSLSVLGGTITGGTIRTASSGLRVVMESDRFRGIDENERTYFDMIGINDAPIYFDKRGQARTLKVTGRPLNTVFSTYPVSHFILLPNINDGNTRAVGSSATVGTFESLYPLVYGDASETKTGSTSLSSFLSYDLLQSGETFQYYGYNHGSSAKSYKIEIDGVGTPNTFKWSDDGGSTWVETGVSINSVLNTLTSSDGSEIKIKFDSITGADLGDYWTFTVGAVSSSAESVLSVNQEKSFNTGVVLDLTSDAITSTNFKKMINLAGTTIYKSDGTTPNGNLSGSAGDICFGADSGKAYYCTGTTSWTAM